MTMTIASYTLTRAVVETVQNRWEVALPSLRRGHILYNLAVYLSVVARERAENPATESEIAAHFKITERTLRRVCARLAADVRADPKNFLPVLVNLLVDEACARAGLTSKGRFYHVR